MQIYLVRHTTPDIVPGICYGRQDLGLAASFDAEAAAVRSKLQHLAAPAAEGAAAFSATHVYCSPLQRCLLLAQRLSSRPPTADKRLLEMNFGEWQMQPWANIPAAQLQAWGRDPIHFAPPQGETAAQMAHRAHSFAEDLHALDAEATALVVSHGGLIHMLVAALLNAPLHVAVRLHVDYASVTRIDLSAGQSKLICLNR